MALELRPTLAAAGGAALCRGRIGAPGDRTAPGLLLMRAACGATAPPTSPPCAGLHAAAHRDAPTGDFAFGAALQRWPLDARERATTPQPPPLCVPTVVPCRGPAPACARCGGYAPPGGGRAGPGCRPAVGPSARSRHRDQPGITSKSRTSSRGCRYHEAAGCIGLALFQDEYADGTPAPPAGFLRNENRAFSFLRMPRHFVRPDHCNEATWRPSTRGPPLASFLLVRGQTRFFWRAHEPEKR